MVSFQRNAIIVGYINSYCLVCERFFETEEQTFTHIRDGNHETKLLLHPYMEKYGYNCIRKVKAGYFCEHCSILMATAAKVNLHVNDKLHYNNKGNCLLKQSGSVLTAFDDVLISESAWHSIAEDACAMCDAEFDEPDEHKTNRSHVLKLLQNKVEFNDDNIYRKIDKNYFQCLTCNCVLLLSTIVDHFNGDIHKQKYIQCQEDKKKYDLAKEKVDIKDGIVENKDEVNNKGMNKNIDTVTGNIVTKEVIKKADTQPEPTLKLDIKTETTTKMDANVKENDRQKDETDIAKYAKDNKLAYDPKNTSAFCKICSKKFPSTLRGMKEHVQGRDHINKDAKASSKPAPKKTNLYQKKPIEEFVNHVVTFNNTLDNDTVINETICIPEKSCHLITKVASRCGEYKCQICLMIVSEDDIEEHCRTAKHEKGIRQTLLIMGLKNEFIREVRPETFHCGYCNIVLAGWPATEDHLKTAEHKAGSATCSRRLQIHLPVIQAQKNEAKIKAAFFQMFANHMRI